MSEFKTSPKRLYQNCPACKEAGPLDEETGLCRPCWRVLHELCNRLKEIIKQESE